MRTDIIFIISRLFLLRMRNISDKSCRENQNKHFVFSNLFFENSAVYEIVWKNGVEWSRPQMKIWRMRIACGIPKATNTHLVCVMFINFPLEQWLHEGASVLRYTYIGSLVKNIPTTHVGTVAVFRILLERRSTQQYTFWKSWQPTNSNYLLLGFRLS